MVRVLVILALVLSQVIFGCPDRMLPGGAPYAVRALEYSFHHASWWHLAVNTLSVWTVYRPHRKDNIVHLFVSFVVAFLVYPISLRPCLGFSNILYATIGMRTPAISSPWWRTTPIIVFLVVTVAMLFFPQFSGLSHIAAFACGMLTAAVQRFYKKNLKDADRFIR